MDIVFELCLDKKKDETRREMNEGIPSSHVSPQKHALPVQPEDLKIGDVVIVGGPLERQDLKGARGLVISNRVTDSKKRFIVKVPPHGDLELKRTQIIFLHKGSHPETQEGKSLLEEQRRFNESDLHPQSG